MKSRIVLVVAIILIILLSACGKGVEETVAKSEYEEVVSKLSEAEDNQKQMQAELENIKKELEALKTAIQEEESQEIEAQTETLMEEKEEEGLTIATEPIVVPDPSTQSEFVVEVTSENFLSIFEFVAINQYDSWGDYTSKLCGFSSLLYEQGWAIGRLEDFGVEYDVFDYDKLISIGVTAGKLDLSADENAEAEVRIYRAKGTLTCYPIEDVKDTERSSSENARFIMRLLPDGSEVEIVTDVDGIMVY